ncbi:MAG: OmpH family outer membrane protein [Prevotellaceae bacterium]|nr:OmpH family outer membrane protein [Prevotellaceae bacterium]
MRKKIFMLMALLAAGMAAHAQQYALIDTEYILARIPAYQSANEQLEQSSKQWQQEVEEATQAAKALYDDYQANAKDLTDDQRTQKEEEIVAKEKTASELRRNYFGPQGEMYKLQERLMQPIQNDIYEAVKAISQEAGYDVVVDRASATSIIFASPEIDISDEVLIRLGYSN